MKARRDFLRLSYWAKVMSMKKSRLVRRMYESSRRALETDEDTDTWVKYTRDLLNSLDLGDYWDLQATCDLGDWLDF